MKNRILIISFFLILITNCGYTPLYKDLKESAFKISISKIDGDRELSNYVYANLRRYSLSKAKKLFTIDVVIDYEKSIISKDSTGKASNYQLTASSLFDINFQDSITGEKFNREISISENFNMKSMANKIDERQYEKSIKKNLARSITQELILKLSSLK